jgi:hypothetical protein
MVGIKISTNDILVTNFTVRNIDTLLEVSAIDIKLNNKLTTVVNIYDTDNKTTQSEYRLMYLLNLNQY